MEKILQEIEWGEWLRLGINVAVVIAVSMVVWLVISKSLNAMVRNSKISSSQVVPIRLLVRYLVLFVALIFLLIAFGVPIGNFWTLVSTVLGLVAIGFVAVWSVLSNISSTFLIFIFQPFRPGDFVKIVGDDIYGEVIDINFMFTTLRTTSGDTYRVPNNQFFQKTTLRPADRAAFEADLKKDKEEKEPEAKDIDHSQQNLEGIQLQPPKGPR